MKEVNIVVMQGCPYCVNAKRAVEELAEENADFGKVQVNWLDENLEPEKVRAVASAYYYVPSIFIDREKLYEAQPGHSYETTKEAVAGALAAAIK